MKTTENPVYKVGSFPLTVADNPSLYNIAVTDGHLPEVLLEIKDYLHQKDPNKWDHNHVFGGYICSPVDSNTIELIPKALIIRVVHNKFILNWFDVRQAAEANDIGGALKASKNIFKIFKPKKEIKATSYYITSESHPELFTAIRVWSLHIYKRLDKKDFEEFCKEESRLHQAREALMDSRNKMVEDVNKLLDSWI